MTKKKTSPKKKIGDPKKVYQKEPTTSKKTNKKETAKMIMGIMAVMGLIWILIVIFIRYNAIQKRGEQQPPQGDEDIQEPPQAPVSTRIDLSAPQGSKGVNWLVLNFPRPVYVTTILANILMAQWPDGGGRIRMYVCNPNTNKLEKVFGPQCIKAGQAMDISATVAREINGIAFYAKAAYPWECMALNPGDFFNGGKLRRVTGQWVAI